MCRDPRVCIPKDCVSTIDLGVGKKVYGQMTAVGQCGASLCSGLPVLQEFYATLQREGGGVVHKEHTAEYNSGFKRLAAGMVGEYRAITEESRYSFWLAFGITPQEQTETESMHKSWCFQDANPRVIDHTHGISFLIRNG